MVGVCEPFKPLGKFWHVSCPAHEPRSDLKPSSLDRIKQETFSMARSRSMLLDVIRVVRGVAVSD
jgi:hypothetical protein